VSFWKKRLKPRLLVVYALAIALVWFASPTPTGLVIGGVLVALGEGLRVWATGHLQKNEELTISGPYGFLRHPLYLGSLLIASGFAYMGQNLVTLTLFGLFVLFYFGYYMPYKNRIEGARLESLYGDAYRRYAVAVPPLLPRLHAYRPLGGAPSEQLSWRALRFADNNETGTAVVVGIGALAMVARALFL
jgi:protein-S-isoprenylcysteine O-methyltransferase Ste14